MRAQMKMLAVEGVEAQAQAGVVVVVEEAEPAAVRPAINPLIRPTERKGA